jgi:hypothetical protein
LALFAFVGGCATNEEYAQKLAEIDRTTPICSSTDECEAKWAAARKWVLDNAGWKLQIVNDDFMQTANPGQYSVYLAARVNKEPLGGGSYKIVAEVWCNNAFGCSPDRLSALLDFNKTVDAAYLPKTAP